jgi:hypothetical protein
MSVKRDSFVYHLSWEDVMDNLPEEVREEVRGAIIGYARTGVTPELKPLAKVAFEFVKKDMDWDFQKYQSMVTARSESGKKGAAARDANASNAKQGLANQANASLAKQTKQGLANQADNVYDNVYDNVTQCVCDNAHARAREHISTPHTDFDFFFPIFWKRNIHGAEAETRRFLDFYEAGGWVLEKGAALDTDEKRLAKARQWKPEKPGKRFPDRFVEAWWNLAQKAPEGVRRQMLSDKVAVDLTNPDPVLRIGEATHAWLMGEGRAEAETALLKEWLQNSQTLHFRKY